MLLSTVISDGNRAEIIMLSILCAILFTTSLYYVCFNFVCHSQDNCQYDIATM